MAAELARRAGVIKIGTTWRVWDDVDSGTKRYWLEEARKFCMAIDEATGVVVETRTWKELGE